MARAGISLREVARQVGVSPAYLSRLLNEERGLPADETISKLEQVLKVDPPGALFDAAGRTDRVSQDFLERPGARPLMRSLAPLTKEEFAKVVELAARLAQKHDR